MSGHWTKSKFKNHKSRQPCANNAFTLVEVAISIAILGISMTTLLGMQSKYVASYIQDRNLTQAVLAAQYLMTMFEVKNEDPATGSKSGDLISALETAGYFEELENNSLRSILKNWQFEQTISSLDIHESEDLLRRIDLVIQWGENSASNYSLTYFIKTKRMPKAA